ncbi:MAG: IS1634 family transposase [Alkaliphilus sp.]
MASLQKRKVKGNYYWYIVESKRINGKPRPITIAYLGSVEKILEMVQNGGNNREFKSYLHGSVWALWNIAKKNNILEILNEVFSSGKRAGLSKGETILLAAIYRVVHPGSKNEFSKWASTTTLPVLANFNEEKVTSQHFWDQMNGITEEMLSKVEDRITKTILAEYNICPEKLALDYTNYFTYIDSNNKSTLTKRGHNKQKRTDLRQFSLALLTTKEMSIPLCSHVYEGNVNDVSVFPKYLEEIKNRFPFYGDISKITLIYDKGSVSKKNLELLDDSKEKIKYICGFSLSSCKDLYDIPLTSYKKIKVKERDILVYRIKKNIWKRDRECILSHSKELETGQYIAMKNSIHKKRGQLNELKSQLNNKKSRISKKAVDVDAKIKKILAGDYGDEIIKIEKTGIRIIKDINHTVDEERINEIKSKYYGKRLLITNNVFWSTQSIMESYIDQYNIENIFKDTKNPHHFAIRSQYHWADSKVRVHTFTCILGLLLTSVLRKELIEAGIKTENGKLVDTLSNIRQTYILNPNKKRKSGFEAQKVLEKMSKEEEKIWNVLESIFKR